MAKEVNVLYPISKHQLDDFKNHALAFACALKEIDSSCVLKGRKRVDFLAKVCGYDNHGQLVALAKGYEHTVVLCLFTPQLVSFIAKTLHELTGFTYHIVVAALINAAGELYSDVEFGWTADDVGKYGNEVLSMVRGERHG